MNPSPAELLQDANRIALPERPKEEDDDDDEGKTNLPVDVADAVVSEALPGAVELQAELYKGIASDVHSVVSSRVQARDGSATADAAASSVPLCPVEMGSHAAVVSDTAALPATLDVGNIAADSANAVGDTAVNAVAAAANPGGGGVDVDCACDCVIS